MRAAPLALRDRDCERLEAWLRSLTIQGGLAQRAQIVLWPCHVPSRLTSKITTYGWRTRLDRALISALGRCACRFVISTSAPCTPIPVADAPRGGAAI